MNGQSAVVVTRFECPSFFTMLVMVIMHVRMKRMVAKQATGFIDARMILLWRRRTLLNISLWDDLSSIRSMGNVPRHVKAARVPARLGAVTVSGVYTYAGDWRNVLFGLNCESPSPLTTINKNRSAT